MTVKIQNAKLGAEALIVLSDLDRTITVGRSGPTTFGYAQAGNPPGVISDDHFDGVVITSLIQVHDEEGPSFFRIRFEEDVGSSFFEGLDLQTARPGYPIIRLLVANSQYVLQSGMSQYSWGTVSTRPPAPVYLEEDQGLTFGWRIF